LIAERCYHIVSRKLWISIAAILPDFDAERKIRRKLLTPLLPASAPDRMAKSKEVNAMPTVHVPVHLTVEQLLVAVKQLSPGELREFTEQFAAWQKQHDQRDEEETALLAVVEENSRLPLTANISILIQSCLGVPLV
jgi:hypothetical protein